MSKAEKMPVHTGDGAQAGIASVMSENETINQVRELLFGGEKRSTDQRFRDADDKLEALRADMLARFSMLESQLAETHRQLDNQHNAAVDEIAAAITDMGARVRKLVTAPRGK